MEKSLCIRPQRKQDASPCLLPNPISSGHACRIRYTEPMYTWHVCKDPVLIPEKGWSYTNNITQFHIKLPSTVGDDHLPNISKTISLVWLNIQYKQHSALALWNNLIQMWLSSVHRSANLNLPIQSTTEHKLLMRPTKKSSFKVFPLIYFFGPNRTKWAMHLEQPWARTVEIISRTFRVQMKNHLASKLFSSKSRQNQITGFPTRWGKGIKAYH